LELDGLKVDLAGDGDEAWRRLQNHPYDCIILDMKMPGMNGQQLYQAIRALGQELTKKIIFITGDTVSSEILDFIAATGSPALTKPVDLDQLRQWVRSSLEPAVTSA
jgi:two-component system NtrC family sensor kinase